MAASRRAGHSSRSGQSAGEPAWYSVQSIHWPVFSRLHCCSMSSAAFSVASSWANTRLSAIPGSMPTPSLSTLNNKIQLCKIYIPHFILKDHKCCIYSTTKMQPLLGQRAATKQPTSAHQSLNSNRGWEELLARCTGVKLYSYSSALGSLVTMNEQNLD